ncbi:MAG TPA: RecX family transcriptional regulator [Armatimonadota bacterium]|jgi:regulatory protein
MDDQRTITAIEPQRRKGRMNIYLDGEFVMGVSEEVVAALYLGVGQRITEDRLALIVHDETLTKARDRAYLLLSYRARSEREIRDRLSRAGYEEGIVQEVVEKLYALGFLDDKVFAESFIRNRAATRPEGRRALTHELRSKGVDARTVAEATAGMDAEAEREAALAAARSRVERWRGLERLEARRKAVGFLQRRGFTWDTIISVLDAILPSSHVDEVSDNDIS